MKLTKEWLERMAKAEKECGEVSVVGADFSTSIPSAPEPICGNGYHFIADGAEQCACQTTRTTTRTENELLRQTLGIYQELLNIAQARFQKILARISDPDHSDELAEDIAQILGIELVLNE